MLLEAIKDILMHLLLWSIIPFLWWLIKYRQVNILSWIGLHKVQGKTGNILIWGAIFFALTVISQVFITPKLLPPGITVAETYQGLGTAALIPALAFGLYTGLGEEIFWRGFLGKRLMARLGFWGGNIIHALIFGLLHGVGFSLAIIQAPVEVQLLKILAVGLFATTLTGFSGGMLGYVTEKKAGGSIIPAILIHALGNTLLSLAQAFNIL